MKPKCLWGDAPQVVQMTTINVTMDAQSASIEASNVLRSGRWGTNRHDLRPRLTPPYLHPFLQ